MAIIRQYLLGYWALATGAAGAAGADKELIRWNIYLMAYPPLY